MTGLQTQAGAPTPTGWRTSNLEPYRRILILRTPKGTPLRLRLLKGTVTPHHINVFKALSHPGVAKKIPPRSRLYIPQKLWGKDNTGDRRTRMQLWAGGSCATFELDSGGVLGQEQFENELRERIDRSKEKTHEGTRLDASEEGESAQDVADPQAPRPRQGQGQDQPRPVQRSQEEREAAELGDAAG